MYIHPTFHNISLYILFLCIRPCSVLIGSPLNLNKQNMYINLLIYYIYCNCQPVYIYVQFIKMIYIVYILAIILLIQSDSRIIMCSIIIRRRRGECVEPTYETTTIIYLKGTLEYYNTHPIIDFLKKSKSKKYQHVVRFSSTILYCSANYSTIHS